MGRRGPSAAASGVRLLPGARALVQRLEPACRDEDEAEVKRSQKVKSRAENFSKLLKISKWQNSMKRSFHRGILAKPTASMAFERSRLA